MIDIKFIFKTNIFISNFFIAACHYLLTCSKHGYCSDMGTCQCDEGFYGDSCSSKHYNFLLMSYLVDFLVLLNKAHLDYGQYKFDKYCKNMSKKNQIYLLKIFLSYFHMLYQRLLQQSNIFNIFVVKCIGINMNFVRSHFGKMNLWPVEHFYKIHTLNELELFIYCWDFMRTWTTAPFCIMILIISMLFILIIILLVLCNNNTKCSDHGTCGDDGNCICDNGYYGPNCSSKLNFMILNCTQLQEAALKIIYFLSSWLWFKLLGCRTVF